VPEESFRAPLPCSRHQQGPLHDSGRKSLIWLGGALSRKPPPRGQHGFGRTTGERTPHFPETTRSAVSKEWPPDEELTSPKEALGGIIRRY
jgi:hypothetical protein